MVIQPRLRQRDGAGVRGNRPYGNNWVTCWENLLDLSRSVYSSNNLLPALDILLFLFSKHVLQEQILLQGKPGDIARLTGFVKKVNLISGSIVAFFTFFIALLASLGSEALVEAVNSVIVAIILLTFIIFLGIFFDVIGTAATAAKLPPFNAKAAKKIFGARQAVKIIRNNDIMANFCNDVVGDIAGTLSGAIGAGIVVSLGARLGVADMILSGSVMTSLIAALTVGGKAVGKSIAVNHADNIIFRVAVVVAWWEKLSGIEVFKNKTGR